MGEIKNSFLNEVAWLNAATQSFAINDNQAHVWLISICQNLYKLDSLKKLLDASELIRAEKYKQLKDYQRFIVSRAAQRIILGRYLDTEPTKLNFILGDNKKPYLLNSNGGNLHYNLSHSGDFIILAVATAPVGADVEYVDNAFPFQDILKDNFNKEETAYIGTSTERFFNLWTRKEAILKATGQGLGDHLSVTPALNGTHNLSKMLTGADNNWLLNTFNITTGYVCTVVCNATCTQLKFFEIEL